MQADFANKLRKVLSHERLSAYKDRIAKDGNLNLFSHYAWNMALSESLYPALQALEVALRNTVNEAARDYFDQEDWFENRAVVHHPNSVAALNKVKNTLQRKHKPLTPGRIIAELSFGFWTSLLDTRYEQVLWPQLIKRSFPHMPRYMRTRQELSRRFNRIRILRNRVFHHEPIWYWKDLSIQHEHIMEAITWIEPAMSDLVIAVDRFPGVYRDGLEEIEKQLRRFC